jgi:hypothetical protein
MERDLFAQVVPSAQLPLHGRVARWHIFRTKNPNLGKFWGLAIKDVGILFGYMVYFTAI